MPNKGKVRNDACQINTDMNAYVCSGENAYEYAYLVIENMDHDTMERRLSPLAIITNKGPDGFIDLYNGPARQNWGERLGVWQTTVAVNTVVDVREWVWLLDASKSDFKAYPITFYSLSF